MFIVLSLAIGIATSTAVFSLAYGVLIKPLPIDDPEGIVNVYQVSANLRELQEFSYPVFQELKERRDLFEDLLAYDHMTVDLGTGEKPQRLRSAIVSDNYFEMLGVGVTIGSTFSRGADDFEGDPFVTVLSHSFWSSHFGGAREIVGEVLRINGYPFTVIGVAQPGFFGTVVGYQPALWVPMAAQTAVRWASQIVQRALSTDDLLDQPGYFWVNLLGRLQSELPLEDANRLLGLMTQEGGGEWRVMLAPLSSARLSSGLKRTVDQSAPLIMLLAAVFLLMTCSNVNILLLQRASARRVETATRLAIGATQGHILRQFVGEAAILALLGGALALPIAYWVRSTAWLSSVFPVPYDIGFAVDAPVGIFGLGLTLATGMLCGLIPGLRESRRNLVGELRAVTVGVEQGDGGRRMIDTLVAVQVGLLLVLIACMGLFWSGIQLFYSADLGFRRDVLVGSANLERQRRTNDEGAIYYRELLSNIRGIPGVESASLSRAVPLVGRGSTLWQADSTGLDRVVIDYNVVSNDYFRTMGISLLEGRDFDSTDSEDAPAVVIVNETLARLIWHGERPIGKLSGDARVIGIVDDIRNSMLGEYPQPIEYLPLSQNYDPRMNLVVHARPESRTMVEAVAASTQDSTGGGIPLHNFKTINEHLVSDLWQPQALASMITLFGLIGLLLVVIGVYGATAYAVSQRRHELAVRAALGATRQWIFISVLRRSIGCSFLGLLLGVFISAAVSDALSKFVYEVRTNELWVLVNATLFTTVVVVFSSVLPARTAAQRAVTGGALRAS